MRQNARMPNDETRIERYGRKLHYARQLRKHMTVAEKKLWSALRNHNLGNLKFRRQVPLSEYIVDFLCHERKLVVEVDGSSHETQKEYDEEREQALRSEGYTIIRFTNEEVLNNFHIVLGEILQTALPSPGGRIGSGRGVGGEVR